MKEGRRVPRPWSPEGPGILHAARCTPACRARSTGSGCTPRADQATMAAVEL